MEDLRNESILEGIDIGDLGTTVKYYKKGKITLEEAAEDLNMTVEEIKEKMNKIPAEAARKRGLTPMWSTCLLCLGILETLFLKESYCVIR